MSRLAAVVLHYRTDEATLACVRALLAGTRAPDRLIVVDNGSGERSRATLAAALPSSVELIGAGWNRGFSGGCNLGIRVALDGGADLVLVANSDVIADRAALAALAGALAARPDAGLAGPALVSTGRPPRVDSLGITFSTLTGRMRLRGHGRGLEAVSGAPRLVDGVTGAFMLVRRDVLERVGLFDEAYFFGFEDLDLCLRARRAGFASLVVGAAQVEHVGALSIGARSPRRVYFATRNHLLLARRAARLPPPFGTLRAGCILGYNLAHALLSSHAPKGAALAAFAQGAWDHLRGRYGPDEGAGA